MFITTQLVVFTLIVGYAAYYYGLRPDFGRGMAGTAEQQAVVSLHPAQLASETSEEFAITPVIVTTKAVGYVKLTFKYDPEKTALVDLSDSLLDAGFTELLPPDIRQAKAGTITLWYGAKSAVSDSSESVTLGSIRFLTLDKSPATITVNADLSSIVYTDGSKAEISVNGAAVNPLETTPSPDITPAATPTGDANPTPTVYREPLPETEPTAQFRPPEPPVEVGPPEPTKEPITPGTQDGTNTRPSD